MNWKKKKNYWKVQNKKKFLNLIYKKLPSYENCLKNFIIKILFGAWKIKTRERVEKKDAFCNISNEKLFLTFSQERNENNKKNKKWEKFLNKLFRFFNSGMQTLTLILNL